MSYSGFDDLKGTRAKPSPKDEAAADRAGEARGFVQREPDPAQPERRKRRPLQVAPSSQFNLRASIADIDAFVTYCEQRNISYREAFARAVELLSKDRSR